MSNNINISTQAFGQTNTLADTLVIEIYGHQFVFTEIHTESNTPYFIQPSLIDNQSNKTLSEQLVITLNHLGFLKKTYKHIWINLAKVNFTLCPDSMYDANDARTILEFNCGDSKKQPLLIDDLTSTIKLIYTIEEDLKSTCDKLFPQHQIKHHITVLGKLFLNAEEFLKEDVFLHISQGTITIIVKQQQRILLANHYQAQTNEDVLYYILFIIEQFQLNPFSTQLSIAANFPANDELLSLIKKYIKNVRLVSGNKYINWEQLKGMPQHFNFTSVNRLFCES